MLSYVHWFFAHEAAHLFQIDRGVGFASGAQSWIHEGAANTMAYSLIASMMEQDGAKRFLAGVDIRAESFFSNSRLFLNSSLLEHCYC